MTLYMLVILLYLTSNLHSFIFHFFSFLRYLYIYISFYYNQHLKCKLSTSLFIKIDVIIFYVDFFKAVDVENIFIIKKTLSHLYIHWFTLFLMSI